MMIISIIDKIYLYVKDPNEAKYQYLIKKELKKKKKKKKKIVSKI